MTTEDGLKGKGLFSLDNKNVVKVVDSLNIS